MPKSRHARSLLPLAAGIVLLCVLSHTTPGGARAQVGANGCAPNATYAAACDLGPGTVTDTLTAPDYVKFYRVALPPAGQALRVELQQSRGLQAALIRDASGMTGPVTGGLENAKPEYAADEFGPAIAPAVSDDTAAGGAPPASIALFPAPFESIPFESIPFESIPFESIPFESVAAEHPGFRPIQLVAVADGSADDQALTHFSDAIDDSDDRAANVVLAVWSPAASPRTSPYSVTVSTLAPEATCTPGQGSVAPLPDGFEPLGSAAPAPPPGVTSLILTNEDRWARQFGSDGDQTVMAQLVQLAASPLVNGVVASVDADPGVAAAYAAWDTDLCSATRANAVAAAIKRLINNWLTAYPSIHYVVIAGDDAVIPYFRIADDAPIANEVQYAGQTGLSANSEEQAAFVRRNLLTDDYYADPHGTLSGAGLLYSPQIAIGRLVESPAEVSAAVQTFLSQNGVLNAASGLVTGYDFLSDTANQVAQVFAGHLAPLTNLNGDGWSALNIDADLSGQTGGPDVVFFSGHFAHGAMQTAALDAYPAISLLTKSDLSGKLLFTLGCHSGASIVDAEADPSTGIPTFDWAQAVAALGGVLVANTGYGYGDSDVPAYGQELMLDFANQLAAAGSQGIATGQALAAAKRQYRAHNDGKWDGYHTKTLMESTLYGLPMYRIVMPGAPQTPAPIPDLPIVAAARGQFQYTNAGQSQTGSLMVHAEIDVPAPTEHFASSGRGSYFSTGDSIDVRAFQPVEPQLTFMLPQVPGMTAHGALITGAAYTEMDGFNPIIVRPVWDQTEYEPQFHYDGLTPANTSLINGLANADGSTEQHLVLTAGQFVSTTDAPAGAPNDPGNPYVAGGVAYPHTIGRQRLYQHVSLDVYYSAGNDWRGPALTQASVGCVGAGAASVHVNIGAGTRATHVLAVVDAAGRESTSPLSGAGSQWSGALQLPASAAGAPAISAISAISIEAVDGAGNVTTLHLQPGADVIAGCPPAVSPATPTPALSAAATAAAPPLPATVKITDLGAPTFDPTLGTVQIPVQGTWSTGGSPCNQAGTQWTIAVGATGAGFVPQPLAPALAPCGTDGQPLPWQATLVSTSSGGLVQICASVGTSTTITPSAATAADCGYLSLPAPLAPVRPLPGAPAAQLTPAPPLCNPATQRCR